MIKTVGIPSILNANGFHYLLHSKLMKECRILNFILIAFYYAF